MVIILCCTKRNDKCDGTYLLKCFIDAHSIKEIVASRIIDSIFERNYFLKKIVNIMTSCGDTFKAVFYPLYEKIYKDPFEVTGE